MRLSRVMRGCRSGIVDIGEIFATTTRLYCRVLLSGILHTRMTFPAAVFLCLVLVFLGAIIIGIFQIFRFIYREMGIVAVVIALGLSVAAP